MKLTNGDILNAKEPMEKLLKQKLPLKTSYKIAKIAQKLSEQLAIIDKVAQGLRSTYGVSDPRTPNRYEVKPAIPNPDYVKGVSDPDVTEFIPNPNYQKFHDEVTELMKMEVEIVFEEVTLPDTLEIEPAVLIALNKFVKV